MVVCVFWPVVTLDNWRDHSMLRISWSLQLSRVTTGQITRTTMGIIYNTLCTEFGQKSGGAIIHGTPLYMELYGTGNNINIIRMQRFFSLILYQYSAELHQVFYELLFCFKRILQILVFNAFDINSQKHFCTVA